MLPPLATAEIPFGHKVALRALAKGDVIQRLGQPIGLAQTTIALGAHVHLHNLGFEASMAGRAIGTRLSNAALCPIGQSPQRHLVAKGNFGGGKAGEGLHAGLQVGRQAVQVPGEEFLAEARLDAVPGPGRHLDHALHRLVGTDQQPVPLLAQVEGAICRVTREGGMGFSSEK